MYGGDPTHANYDASNVITTSNAPSLTEAGTTAAATGSSSWITSSPTIGSNDMLYATANYVAPKTCDGIIDPNDFPGNDGYPNDVQDSAAPNECQTTIGELYAYSATGGTSNCPTPSLGNPTLNCQPVWTAVPSTTHGVTTSPAVDTSLSTPVVYVATHAGELYAYNASNGTLLWHSPTLGGSIEASLTIANGFIYVPEDYGWVYVFPSTTGTNGNDQNCWTQKGARECGPDWGYSTGGNNFSTPAVANGMMYQAAGDHVGGNKNDPAQYAVYAFNASYEASQCPGTYAPHEFGKPLSDIATCTPAWSAPWQYGGEWNGGGSSPAVADGDVYIESASNGLLAFSANGSSNCTGTQYVGQWGAICTPLWIGATGREYSGAADIGPTPAVANGNVYIGSRAGNVYAFNATTGTLVWSSALGGAIDSSVVIAGDSGSDDVAFVGCSTGLSGQTCTDGLFALNAASGGTPLWAASTGGSVDNSPIVVDNGNGSATGAAYVAAGNQVFSYALPTSS
ncbi:MAG: PQQ-binding-like beta-propeller repeat protein [Acidimicrobiales bacterium]|nr:PQQ-binding-like beta-propeller repeat protein [Acidimicrobiales bacterium]